MSDKQQNQNEKKQISLSELEVWADRWGISEVQLREAIERTGSQDVDTIEKWLIDHNYLV